MKVVVVFPHSDLRRNNLRRNEHPGRAEQAENERGDSRLPRKPRQAEEKKKKHSVSKDFK